MCKWGTDEIVEVTMQPFKPYHPTEWKKKCKIDKCIAPIVQVLEENGIRMLASCCGHGKCNGTILLLDFTEIVIPIEFTSNKRGVKWVADKSQILDVKKLLEREI